ncbi:MAG: HEAT repeat domain-containing protein [Verrucomicrobia bacterium]|nr:HEAT repeat domain-containing protein [Verrucomicrobiota bacterium]
MKRKTFKSLLPAIIFSAVIVSGLVVILLLKSSRSAEPVCMGMTLTEWLQSSGRLEVGEGIARIGPAAIPFLIKHVEAKETRWTSFYRRIWSQLPASVRSIPPRPHDFDTVRVNALQSLREFGPEAHLALPSILMYLSSTNASNKSPAIEAALSINPNDPEVAPVIRQFVSDPGMRQSAALAIYTTTSYPEGIITSILPIDYGNPSQPPFNELAALGVMGADAAPALQVLVDVLNNPQVRGKMLGNLLGAFKEMGPVAAPAIPALLEILNTSSAQEKAVILWTLMNMGQAANGAVPYLVPLLEDEDAGVRAISAAALVKTGGSADLAIPVLIDVLSNSAGSGVAIISPIRRFGLFYYTFNPRMTSAWLLGELAPHSMVSLPFLRTILSGDYPGWLKVVVARSIYKLTGDADQVLETLILSLENPANEVRVFSCHALGEMGRSAQSAIPHLEKARMLSLNTRRAANEAIAHIAEE